MNSLIFMTKIFKRIEANNKYLRNKIMLGFKVN